MVRLSPSSAQACAVVLLLTALLPAGATAKTIEQELFEVVELAAPDLHLEWGGSKPKLLLSIPIPIALPRLSFLARSDPDAETRCYGHHLHLMPRLLIEPQRQAMDGKWRLLAGARAMLLASGSGMHLRAEGFGTVGQDISGGGFGVGLGYGGWVTVGTRHTWTQAGMRHEVNVDLTLFSIPWGNHMQQARNARSESRCESRYFSDRRFGLIPAPYRGRQEGDADPPTVVHTPCDFRVGTNLSIQAELFDASAVFEPMVVYKLEGGTRQEVQMQRVGETHRFHATLPTAGSRRPVRYWLEAFDVAGNGPGMLGSSANPLKASPTVQPALCRE